tara:strand:- start:1013 stop:1864 length:852 start_codon:yes stop_codon:yes gene_type:complete
MEFIINNPIRAQFVNLFYYTGMALFSRKIFMRRGKYILMFHGVSSMKRTDMDSQVQPHLSKDEFESIIFWLKKNFNFLNPNDLKNSNKNGLLLTFDDGFHNNFSNVLPLLNKHSIPGLFFISTQHVNNPKDWLHFIKIKAKENVDLLGLNKDTQLDLFDGISKKNLLKMASNPLVTIGSHSVSHPLLSKCSNLDLINELVNSKNYLESVTGKSVKYLAYPFGDYNKKVIDAVQKSGYQLAFGVDKINNLGQLNFEIPRIGIYSSEIPYLAAKLSGLYSRPVTF